MFATAKATGVVGTWQVCNNLHRHSESFSAVAVFGMACRTSFPPSSWCSRMCSRNDWAVSRVIATSILVSLHWLYTKIVTSNVARMLGGVSVLLMWHSWCRLYSSNSKKCSQFSSLMVVTSSLQAKVTASRSVPSEEYVPFRWEYCERKPILRSDEKQSERTYLVQTESISPLLQRVKPTIQAKFSDGWSRFPLAR